MAKTTKTVTKKVMAARKKWVKALRSGKFKQTEGALYNGKAYCCLGVACRLDARENGKKFILCNYDNYDKVLPPSMTKKLDIGSYGELKKSIKIEGREYSALTGLNDEAGYSFKQIADVIEDQFIKNVKVK